MEVLKMVASTVSDVLSALLGEDLPSPSAEVFTKHPNIRMW